MKNLLFIIIALVCFSACDMLEQVFPDPDFVPWHPPQPVVQQDTPCANYVHINNPNYFQGYVEFDNLITDYVVLNVGSSGQNAPYQDTIFAGNESTIPDVLAAMFSAYLPQYDHEVLIRPDAKRWIMFTKGSDNNSLLNGKVWIRASGAKWYPSFQRRSFYLSGVITDTAQWVALCNEYPSMTGFNLRDCTFDSLEEKTAMLGVLHHDLCKAGESRADFRFNNFEPSDSIVQAFLDAGWQNVLTNVTGAPIVVRGSYVGVFKSESIADTRGYCATEDQILYLLEQGYVVIADL